MSRANHVVLAREICACTIAWAHNATVTEWIVTYDNAGRLWSYLVSRSQITRRYGEFRKLLSR